MLDEDLVERARWYKDDVDELVVTVLGAKDMRNWAFTGALWWEK